MDGSIDHSDVLYQSLTERVLYFGLPMEVIPLFFWLLLYVFEIPFVSLALVGFLFFFLRIAIKHDKDMVFILIGYNNWIKATKYVPG